MVSIKTTAAVLTLLSICLLHTHTAAALRGCCRSYMTIRKPIPFLAIRGYSIQTMKENCHINAIILHTKKGSACMDPALNWVMEYVDLLRNKAKQVHNKTSRQTN